MSDILAAARARRNRERMERWWATHNAALTGLLAHGEGDDDALDGACTIATKAHNGFLPEDDE